jgi:hypothetical protein
MHELKVLVDIFYYGGTYGQQNLTSLSSFECAARRLQLNVAAHVNPSKPDWSQARYFTSQQGPEDCVDPGLRSFVNRKEHEGLMLNGRGQGGVAITAVEAVVDAPGLGALPGAGAPRGRGRGRPAAGGRGAHIVAPSPT